MRKLLIIFLCVLFQPTVTKVATLTFDKYEYIVDQQIEVISDASHVEDNNKVEDNYSDNYQYTHTVGQSAKDLIQRGVYRVSYESEWSLFGVANAQLANHNAMLRYDDHVSVPNQVTSRTAFVPFTDAVNNDWQGRYFVVEMADGNWMAMWVEGTNHSDYNTASHKFNIHFSNDEGATWSANNTYIGGAAVTGFPLVPPGGSSTGFVDMTIIVCPNGDLVLIAQNRGVNASAWNGVNFSQHQYRSTDNGASWTYEFDYCNSIGFTTAAQKASIQGLFENMVVGNTVYVTHCEIRTDLNDTRISLYKSTDNCATWSLVSHPVEFDELTYDATASAIAHTGGGRFICIIRTQDLGSGYKKISLDNGLTWGAADDFTAELGYVGIHDPKVKQFSNFFLLFGRDSKRIVGDPNGNLFMRNSWWTTNDLFETSARRHYLDPFYSGTGVFNSGDAGYVRALPKADGTLMFFGYFGTPLGPNLIYKYDVSHTNTPSQEQYSNINFLPESITSTGIRLQLNRDNITPSPSVTPVVGDTVLSRAHNYLTSGDDVFVCGGTNNPEFIVENNKGWAYFNNSRIESTGSLLNSLVQNSFSYAFWLDPDDGNPAANQRIWMAANGTAITAQDQVFAQLQTDGKLLFRYTANDVVSTFITNVAVFANGPGVARHVAVVIVSGVAQTIYIDGATVAHDGVNTGSMAGITMTNFQSTEPIYWGQRRNGAGYDLPYIGKIREFILQPVGYTGTNVTNIMSN